MSEFHTDNPQLYQEMGLGYLLHGELPEADPALRVEGYTKPLDEDGFVEFFERLEREHPLEYEGYKKCANRALVAIETASFNFWEDKVFDIPLIPRRATGIYDHEATHGSHALRELMYELTGAEIMADETATDFQVGRVWLQGRYRGNPVNFIEHHGYDKNGALMKLSAISRVPEDIVDARTYPDLPVYSPQTARAIAISRKLRSLSGRRIHEARDQELDYLLYVRSLPVAERDSPFDKAA